MDGVLINGKRFIPMSAIQVIDMETKTIYYRDNQEDYSHGQRFERQVFENYETCLPTRLEVAASLAKF
jgi:hypothetical protein